ncbi:MAG TPA: dienelactone hydrolase family protein [Burkholderiales bacterium]|nr:dienelactone hydrolase family protein [Burkholderiales bacterium]
MDKKDVTVRASGGGQFDCYVVAPEAKARVPAIVLASAIHGVDADLRGIAEDFAAHGYLAAAPDLFWRSVPGPLTREDPRSAPRGQPRLEKIKAGEADLADTLAEIRKHPLFNGRAAVIGFCYGGPYALIGPRRLGYDAGISCHGTQLLDFTGELDGLRKPVCLIWGDQDHAAPAPVREAYQQAAARMKNLEVHVFPGVQHGYMMRSAPKAWDPKMYDFSMGRALELLGRLREAPARESGL